MIACIDVAYRDNQARAACVVLEHWSDAMPQSTYLTDVGSVEPYQPGSFYRRELPCLLAVLRLLPARPDVIVIDGYVWLSAERQSGLGAHLYFALDETCAVIGVAKTEFLHVCSTPLVARVLRGKSKKPLYVTSIGIDLDCAAASVQIMHGAYRIPTALSLADRAARSRT